MSSGLPSHVEEADLISYGLLGLISAIERFEPEREIKFETFAITRIKGSMIDELRSLDWVPRSVRTKAREIEKCQRQARAPAAPRAHRPGDGEELRRHGGGLPGLAGADLELLGRGARRALDGVRRLGRPGLAAGHDPGPRAPDPAQEMDTTEMKDRLADAIARLPEREKLVVALYYYENLTLREIGEVLGVTESRVSQLHTKAVLRLKSRLQGDPIGERRLEAARPE